MKESELIANLATLSDATQAVAHSRLELSINDIPTVGLRDYIVELAKNHSITYKKTSQDDLAEMITSLSGDAVELDEVELLLIALERAGIIESKYVVPLHVNYLREKLNEEEGVLNYV